MKTGILSIFTRSPLHVGAGASVGVVDQPIIRERATGYPVIPGSTLKGVLADFWNEKIEVVSEGKNETAIIRSKEGVRLFGSTDSKKAAAGALLIGESKLLAFPVRSAKGGFAWVTSPLALKRFVRDVNLSVDVSDVDEDRAIVTAPSEVTIGRNVVLEEFSLETLDGEKAPLSPDLLKKMASLSDDIIWESVGRRLVVLSDNEFSYFVRNNCEIAQHNKIDDEKGVVDDGFLFNQENVPSETLFYAVINAKDPISSGSSPESEKPPLEELSNKLSSEGVGNLLQIGADITTGLGWCAVKFIDIAKKGE